MQFISLWENDLNGINQLDINKLLSMKGFIGFIFTSAFWKFIFNVLAILILLLAVIGLITVIVWIIKLKRRKKA